MGPYGYAEDSAAREKAEARLLAAIAEEFPDIDIHGVFGGYEALPRGTEVIRAMTLDSMMGKLAERRGKAAGEAGHEP